MQSLRLCTRRLPSTSWTTFFFPVRCLRSGAPFVLLLLFAFQLPDPMCAVVKASTRKTPQPSTAIYSDVLRAQGATDLQAYIGTEERLSTLRAECLMRDRYRHVISRKFSDFEFTQRHKLYGIEARDDDCILFSDQDNIELDPLEVAHILPHSLMKASTGSEMVCLFSLFFFFFFFFKKRFFHNIRHACTDPCRMHLARLRCRS